MHFCTQDTRAQEPREEGCDVAVLSINDVGGDRVIWERTAARLAWDTQSMSHMCVSWILCLYVTYTVCIASRTREDRFRTEHDPINHKMVMRFMTQYNPEGRIWQKSSWQQPGWRNYRRR